MSAESMKKYKVKERFRDLFAQLSSGESHTLGELTKGPSDGIYRRKSASAEDYSHMESIEETLKKLEEADFLDVEDTGVTDVPRE